VDPVTTDLEPLLEPITIGPARLRNRVFVAPHTTNFGSPGENLITETHLDYHRERARGGAGLIITEGIRVHPTSLRRLGVHAYDERAMPGLTRLAETVHAEGTGLFAQILHTGRHSGDEHQGSWGAGPTPWTTGAHTPHVMNAFDIDTAVAGFAAASARVVEAGFDGLEVHLGHGHLLQQFLSPLTNDRRDGYGGSPRARLRLAREVLIAVVESVGGRAAVGLRLSADEFLPGGLGPDDVVQAVTWLREEVPLDFLHVSHSAYIGASSLSTQMADMSYPKAPFRHLPARFRREFPDLPVLAVCRLDTLATGAEMLAAGEADLVGFARAHIAEPALTNRTLHLAGPKGPRSCIACNQGCNANLEAVTPITCTVNPAVGHERSWHQAENSHPEPRTVLVVGAGPAGLEAAVTAARRGHRVVLAESGNLGGRLNDIAALGTRTGFATLTSELLAELSVSPVEILSGAPVTAATVTLVDPDVVVLATGAATAPEDAARLPGGPPVLDLTEVVRKPERAGVRTVVFDELGSWEAYSLTEQLASRGVAVTLVSPLSGVAPKVTVYSRLGLNDRLAEAGVRLFALHRPVRAEGDRVVIRHTVDRSEQTLEQIDAIVHVRPPRSRTRLFDELVTSGWSGEVHLVGDAFAPRTVQEAIYEGRAVGLTIGVADPAVREGIAARPPYSLPHRAGVPA
jgi:2,4-dienoyl-CoA reductase-like NADH-dependent reductase (Old Yellow Enzyme family)